MPRALVSLAGAAREDRDSGSLYVDCVYTHTHRHTVCRVMAAADYHSRVRGCLSVLRGLGVSNWVKGKEYLFETSSTVADFQDFYIYTELLMC